MIRTAKNQQMLRETNLLRVFLSLKEDSPLTKNDICSRLNLSCPAVDRVDRGITGLLEREFVGRDGHGPSGVDWL